MDKFPLYSGGGVRGELTTEQEPLYTWFSVRCRLPGEGLWCAWAVGERGELRIGVLEPAGDRAVIRRRFSHRMTAPLGRLLRGELRPAGDEADKWEQGVHPPFQTPWIRRQMEALPGVKSRSVQGRRYVAAPYDPGRPFPLVPLFCLARIRMLEGRQYAVFAFDDREWPVLH